MLEDEYPYKEYRNIKKISKTHKNHPAIQIPTEAKKIVDIIKKNSKSDEEIAKGICKWVNKYIDYDISHAEASKRHKEGKNKIYMNAEEVFKTRTGICGETSLLVVGMAEHAGIAGTMYRPFSSHLSTIMEGDCNKNGKQNNGKTDNSKTCRWICDTTFNKFEKYHGEPTTYKSSKESHYEIGVTDVANNWKYNWEKRREPIKELSKKYGKELSTEEILDIERADLCHKLKYGTAVGLEMEKENKIRCIESNKEKETKKILKYMD